MSISDNGEVHANDPKGTERQRPPQQWTVRPPSNLSHTPVLSNNRDMRWHVFPTKGPWLFIGPSRLYQQLAKWTRASHYVHWDWVFLRHTKTDKVFQPPVDLWAIFRGQQGQKGNISERMPFRCSWVDLGRCSSLAITFNSGLQFCKTCQFKSRSDTTRATHYKASTTWDWDHLNIVKSSTQGKKCFYSSSPPAQPLQCHQKQRE